jgi:hypothetical protein
MGAAEERDFSARQLEVARAYTSRMTDLAASQFSGDVRVHLVVGSAADGVLLVANRVEASMVVVGTHDYRGVKRLLLGSVAADIARRAHAPVVVVRPLSYPGSTAPAIEPLCTACGEVRAASGGTRMWCERHAVKHPRAHLHYEYPQGFAQGSQLLRGS